MLHAHQAEHLFEEGAFWAGGGRGAGCSDRKHRAAALSVRSLPAISPHQPHKGQAGAAAYGVSAYSSSSS